ncbi:MAG: hypothetical protein WDW38_004466 [Sanguina aurantia]
MAKGHRLTPSGPTNGVIKKLVIKPLKVKPELPTNFEDVTWAKLQASVQAVHCKLPVSFSLEELYAAVQDMCMHKMADKLYGRLQKECDSHLSQQISSLCSSLQLDPVLFLDRINATWSGHCSQMLTIRLIFLYLDRTYVITTTGVRSLFDMGLALFRQHLATHLEVQARCVEGLLLLISKERDGEAVERAPLSSLLRMLHNIGVYADTFQRPFLEVTTRYYQAEGDRLMQELDVPQYLKHCEVRIAEEYERCGAYLDAATRKPLLAALESTLVARHFGALLERGFAKLMGGGRTEDLSRLYSLAGRVGGHDALKAALREYIKSTGLQIVKDEEKDKDMVERLLELKTSLDSLLVVSFAANESFAAALKEAFEHFINQRQSKPAELIAKFIDARLKSGGSKGSSEADLEAMLDKLLLLFRYISGKDVFEAFYKKDLAKRLLLGKSASIDVEKQLISKLKTECGSQFTNKLEGMFKDVELSKDVMAAYRAVSAADLKGPGMDMSVSVLTSGFWPTYPLLDVMLPQELGVSQEVFKEFYLKKYSGRKLVWQHSLGTCVVRAAFPKGTKELSLSTFQAVVMMLFNSVDTLSYQEIKETTGIEVKELRRTLQSLACGKVRVLNKEPKGRDVDDSDSFSFNAGFSEKLFRIKINSIQMKETEEENKKTNDQVLQDRQYQIDAALVRIMKTRKSLSHKLLIQEALQQLKFPLKATDLKKRIESLIDREYLARDNADPNLYIYLA